MDEKWEWDYRFNTQFFETRIESLLDFAWAEFARTGQITMRQYVFAVSFE